MATDSLLRRAVAWARQSRFAVEPGTFSLSADGLCLTVLDFDASKAEDSDGVLFGAALGVAAIEGRRVCVLGPSGTAVMFAEAATRYALDGLDRQAGRRASLLNREFTQGPVCVVRGQLYFVGGEGVRVVAGASFSPSFVTESGELKFSRFSWPADYVFVVPNLELFPQDLIRQLEAAGQPRIISSAGTWQPKAPTRRS